MVENNLPGTKGKLCSPEYNSNTSCVVKISKQKISKPEIFTEEPNRLQTPVIVSYFKQKQFGFQNFTNRRWRSWRSRKPQYETKERFNICRWYKRKRALKSLRDQSKKEQKKEIRRRREEYERERMNDIMLWEYGKLQKAEKEERSRRKREEYQRERVNNIIRSEYAKQQKAIVKYEKEVNYVPPEEKKQELAIKETKRKPRTLAQYEPRVFFAPPKKKKKEIIIKETKQNKPKPWTRLKKKIDFPVKKKEKQIVEKKKTFIKEKSATAKPQARTKQVTVKKYKPKDSLTNRFVNCCYRICCQFYCCLTCILLIAFVIIFVI